MSSTRNMCFDRTSHRRLRALKWLCLLMLLAWFGQRPHMAGCSWFLEMRQRLRGRLKMGRHYRSGNDTPACFSLDVNPRWRVRHTERVSRQIYNSLMAMRNEFREPHARETRSVDSTEQDSVIGQPVVGELVTWAINKKQRLSSKAGELPNQDKSSPCDGILREDEVVTLQSAVTGSVEEYRFRYNGFSWVLEAPSGKQHIFNVWTLKDGQAIEDSILVEIPEDLRASLELPAVFGVSSCAALVRDFSVLCISDLLTHPSGNTFLSFSGSFKVLNFIPVWKEVAISMWGFLVALQGADNLPPATEHAVTITKLNVTLQMIRIIGRISINDVILKRFNLSNFFIDSGGRVLLKTFNPVRRQEQQKAQERQCAKPTCATGRHRRRTVYDSTLNAQALIIAVLFVWCPRIAQQVSIYTLPPSADYVLRATRDCHSMPPEIREIAHSVYKRGEDAASILFSKLYSDLCERLRQLLHQSVRIS